jgi:hypothetical protein
MKRPPEEQFPYCVMFSGFNQGDFWVQSAKKYGNEPAPENERVELSPPTNSGYPWYSLAEAALQLMEREIGGHADRFDPFPIAIIFSPQPPSRTTSCGQVYVDRSGQKIGDDPWEPAVNVTFSFPNATAMIIPVGGISAKTPLSVSTPFKWDVLDAEQFERLIFSLYEDDESFSEVQWLQHVNSPDSGRDISAKRVESGNRILIQARHKNQTIPSTEVNECVTNAETWDPPFDEVLISTTSTFRESAIRWAEQNNKKKLRPIVGLEPKSQLEVKLSRRPDLIAQLGLR